MIRRLATTVALGGLLIVPMGALVLLRATDEGLDAIARDATPALQAATARTVLDERRVVIILAWTEGRALRSAEAGASAGLPGGTAGGRGIVTAVFKGPGTTVAHGDALYSVDGVVRIAVASVQPFSRPLRTGDTGSDVSALHDVLLSLGYLAAPPASSSTYGTATQNSMRALKKSLSAREPDGDFDPSLFVWLPESPFRLGTFAVEVAAPPPAAGQKLGEEAARLASATLVSANAQEALSFPVGVEAVLVIGSARILVDSPNLPLGPDALRQLEPLLKPKTERADGTLQRAAPLNAAAVPSTAIQVNASGALCAWVPEGGSYRAVSVKVAGARAGVTNVTEGLAPGQQVLTNPAEILESPRCP